MEELAYMPHVRHTGTSRSNGGRQEHGRRVGVDKISSKRPDSVGEA
jgi:hypothetical protein